MATCINNNASVLSATLLNDAKFIRVRKFASTVYISNSKPDWNRSKLRATKEKTEEIESPSSTSSADDVTLKFGLEAGLWKVRTATPFIYYTLSRVLEILLTLLSGFHVVRLLLC